MVRLGVLPTQQCKYNIPQLVASEMVFKQIYKKCFWFDDNQNIRTICDLIWWL